MRVLVSALACHPTGGSEGYVGWAAVNALAKSHNLTVLTHGGSRESLENAMRDHPLREKVVFCYIGKPRVWHQNRMVARFQSWLDYRKWCRGARVVAKRLVSESKFDLGHHVTYATWRMGSPLAGLGIPWVFGPIGGGEVFPNAFLGILSPQARIFELIRALSGWLGRHSPRIRSEIMDASRVLASNGDTARMLVETGVPDELIQVLSQSFLNDSKMRLFSPGAKPPVQNGLRIFAGGNLEGRKGVSVVLHALAKLRDRGIPFRFVYGGQGPEYLALCKMAERFRFDGDSVRLGIILSSEDYRKELQESHIYLLPSLRESAGLTLAEAMLSGCVPVVARCGGPAMLVSEDCGFALAPTNPEDLAQGIAEVLEQLWRSPDLLSKLSFAAAERIQMRASEEAYLRGTNEAYERALNSSC